MTVHSIAPAAIHEAEWNVRLIDVAEPITAPGDYAREVDVFYAANSRLVDTAFGRRLLAEAA